MKNRLDLIKQKNARVASIDLDVGEESPWHYHSNLIENIVCLSGDIAVEFKNPNSNVCLSPGQRLEVKSRQVHRLMNNGSGLATYLLIQNGEFDFVEASDA